MQAETAICSKKYGGRSGALQWDGSTWQTIALPDLSTLGSAWRIDEIVAVPGGDVWVSGIVVVSAFESRPMLLRRRDGEWDRVEDVPLHPQTVYPFAPRNGAPEAMTASSASDVWVIGTAAGNRDGRATSVGMALHFDGSSWTEYDLPQVANRHHDLAGADASSPTDVWAVGTSRLLLPIKNRGILPVCRVAWARGV